MNADPFLSFQGFTYRPFWFDDVPPPRDRFDYNDECAERREKRLHCRVGWHQKKTCRPSRAGRPQRKQRRPRARR